MGTSRVMLAVALTMMSCSIATMVPYVMRLGWRFIGGEADGRCSVSGVVGSLRGAVAGVTTCNAMLLILMLPNRSVRTLLMLLGSDSTMSPIIP